MGSMLSEPNKEFVDSERGESTGITWGVSSIQGWRIEMEDQHLIVPHIPGHSFIMNSLLHLLSLLYIPLSSRLSCQVFFSQVLKSILYMQSLMGTGERMLRYLPQTNWSIVCKRTNLIKTMWKKRYSWHAFRSLYFKHQVWIVFVLFCWYCIEFGVFGSVVEAGFYWGGHPDEKYVQQEAQS